jgi:type II secretory pathway component PulF
VRFEDFIFLITIVLVPLLVCGFCRYRATELQHLKTAHNARLLARRVSRLIVVNLGMSIVCTLFGLVMSIGLLTHGDQDIGVVIMPLYTVLGLFLSLSTKPLFRIRTSLRAEPDDDDYAVPTVPQPLSRAFGITVWSILGVTVSILTLFVGLGLFFLSVLFFALIPLLFWQSRRAREGQLLWLLALSVRNSHDLAQEVQDHASTWTGAYAVRLRQLAVYLKAGRPLGLALERVPGLLPLWVVASIKIGEETGSLSEVLNECATAELSWMKNRFRTGSIGSLLIYLACYPWVILGPVTFIMYYIVPKFKAIFQGFGTELPRATENFIYLYDNGLPLILLMAPVSLVGVIVLLRFDHAGWRNVRIRLFRKFYPRYDMAPIMRHLARTIEKGKTLPDGLLAIANSYHRPTVADSVAQVYVEAESGGDCWKSLLERGYLSRRDLTLIEAAKRSGNLPWAIREIADVREKNYIFRIDTFVQFFRPVPILAIGLLVGWICIAMFMPVVKLVNDLS